MERNRAMLIARTETMNAYRDASTDQYRKYGVQSVKWLSACHDRTCDECLSLDGQILTSMRYRTFTAALTYNVVACNFQ